MIGLYRASFRPVAKRSTLDIDDTFDAVHGGQPLRLWGRGVPTAPRRAEFTGGRLTAGGDPHPAAVPALTRKPMKQHEDFCNRR